jgi:hypothetical protein
MGKPKSIEDRVTQQLAVGRYLRAVERFEDSSKDFNEACQHLRKTLFPCDRFCVNQDGKHWIVTTTKDNDFDVEQIDVL